MVMLATAAAAAFMLVPFQDPVTQGSEEDSSTDEANEESTGGYTEEGMTTGAANQTANMTAGANSTS